MTKKLALKSFRLKNFKAIHDSGVVKFSPLTVLIGDNGSGKSSLVEGLQTYQRITKDGLDEAMQMWRGFENIVNPPIKQLNDARQFSQNIDGIEFSIEGETETDAFCFFMKINMNRNDSTIFIESEKLELSGRIVFERDIHGDLFDETNQKIAKRLLAGQSGFQTFWSVAKTEEQRTISWEIFRRMIDWQFVTLQPRWMGEPHPIQRTEGNIRLNQAGSNITEYLLDIMRRFPDAFAGIVETLQYILPYARRLQPVLTSELEQAVHLELIEEEYRVKGWLLSTGTLRLLALLALFRHPEPPPLIVIEEIENGLDPRTIHLIVDEIQDLVESGLSQVIVTTHSPYLLDLLPLSTIVLVERGEFGPTFSRPADDDSIQNWSKKFAPGKLYTMGNLNRHLAL
ncbi:MAG: ATP-binding protein [Chloroflexota bacterium]|nr:ATP-binding protein [Chloroflexota bacterium]